MIEINLLPQRIKGYRFDGKQKKSWASGVFFVLAVMFVFQHVLLSVLIEKHRLQAMNLTNRLSGMHDQVIFPEQSELASLVHAMTEKVQALQQQLNILSILGSHRVRLSKINYHKNQLYLFGYAASGNELSQWASDAVNVNSIKILQIKRARDLNVWQFVAVIAI